MQRLNQRHWAAVLMLTATLFLLPAAYTAAQPPPNILIILTDDMGYGDIGAYGATRIRTPHIDALAKTGLRFTQGYASANVCSPSRAGLLTGRYAMRSGLGHKVVAANDERSLPATEETIAELARRAGYRTAMVGKWHLGNFPQSLPTGHGFDQFYGVPHSNDMPGFSLWQGSKVIEDPVVQSTLTRRYTEAAVDFIGADSEQPFLLFVSHTAPHIPLFPAPGFAGRSDAGAYGDVVEEIDWSTGELVASLRRQQMLENTLIIFTSDNGPFFEGSSGRLRGGKGNSWEGGFRVPFIVSWPAGISQPGVSAVPISNLDILPTLAALTRIDSAATTLDGSSLLPLFKGGKLANTRPFLYFVNETIVGIRSEHWKYLTHSYYTGSLGAFEKFNQLPGFTSDYELLFDLRAESGESYSVAERHPQVVKQLRAALKTAREEFEPLRTQPAQTTYPR